MAKLIFIGEKSSGRVYEFAVEKSSVGRGDHNTLTIHDTSVSHSHAEVLVYGTEVIVRDLGSRNGTFVNGVRLQNQQRPLLAGQIVKFGSVEARLELELASPSDTDTVNDMTAIHSHARHIHNRESESKPADPFPVTPKAGQPPTPEDHTLVLPRLSETTETSELSPETMNKDAEKPLRKPAFALIFAAIVIGLVVICWLLLLMDR